MTAEWKSRSRSEHDRVQGLVLSRWLPAATSFASYWASRAAALQTEPGRLTSRADLERLSPVKEGDVRGVGGPGGAGLVMRPTQDQVKARASGSLIRQIAGAIRESGAVGQRRAILADYKPIHVHRGGADDDLAIAYSRSDLDRLHRCGARAAAVLGLDDADYLVSAVPAGPRLDWWGVYHLAIASSILALHPRGAGDALERVIESFSLMPVTVVVVPVAEAIELAAVLVEAGQDVPRVHTVVTVGPPPTDDERAAILDAWRAAGATEHELVVRAAFAPPEARALWVEPRQAPTGLVTYPDLEVLEVVDALTGEPTDGPGDLTLTTAGWHGTALLRYQTGVYVDGIDRDPCPASGITAPRVVGEVAPRAWQPEVLVTRDAVRHFDFRAAGDLIGRTPGVRSWRLELRAPTQRVPHDRLVVEVGGELDDRDRAQLEEELETIAGLAPAEIKVVADPLLVEAKVDELGSPFVDSR